MGLYDFWWNTVQEGKLQELEDRIKALEEQNKILYDWVQYFKQQLENKE